MGGIDGDDDLCDYEEMKNLKELCARLNLPNIYQLKNF